MCLSLIYFIYTFNISSYLLQHYYIYYCRFGPLVNHWTMRFEAKHNFFKKMANNIGNFINLPYTLAVRHQYLQCYYHLSGDELFEHTQEIGPGYF